MKNAVCWLALAALGCTLAQAQKHEQDRLKHSGEVLMEILNIPDNLPKPILDRAECVIVLPSVKKAAFGIGANIGFQIGVQATDFVILVTNPHGVRSLLRSKVKLGGDASAAAGPKGRDAEAATDVTMHAEILTYSRARGLFAGISLEGSTLRPDGSANNHLYGRDVTAKEIVLEHKVGTPESGHLMVSVLQKASPRNLSDAKSLQAPPK